MTDTRVFDDAVAEVLDHWRYDRLMGRTLDIRRWIVERLEWLFYQIISRLNFPDDTEFNVSAIATVFGIVGVLLALTAAAIIIRSLLNNRMIKEYNLHDMFRELENRDYTVHELIALSDSIKEERYAVRYRYIAALLILNEKQIIKIVPSATNRLIETQIKTHAPYLAPVFNEIAHTFHLSWFGYKEIGNENFERFTKAVSKLSDTDKDLLKGTP